MVTYKGVPEVQDISVVVPAYKKSDVVRQALTILDATLRSSGYRPQFIVVIDGSPDETEREVRQTKIPDLQIVSYPLNMGKGHALRTGAYLCTNDTILFADADLDLSPHSAVNLLELLKSLPTDVVVGSKTHADSIVSYPYSRRVQSSAYRLLIRCLFGLSISDTQTGLKAFKREPLFSALPKTSINGYAFDLELLVQLHDDGFAISEGPVELAFAFESTVRPGTAFGVARDTFAIAVHRIKSRVISSIPRVK